MKKIGIIGAMKIEVSMLQQNMRPLAGDSAILRKEEAGLVFFEGLLNGIDTVVVQSGIGKVNAALCAQRLILRFGVTHIINTGIAGAMAHGLGVLDVVISTDALYHDVDATGFGYAPTVIPQMRLSDFPADRSMLDAATRVFSGLPEGHGHKLVAGRIASGDQFVSSREAKDHIRRICNPACVEMEGAAIAQACYLNGIPFLIIRCISDMADEGEEAAYKFNDKTAAGISASLVLGLLGQL
jgi:adenosylhomocysteine nucleosidase